MPLTNKEKQRRYRERRDKDPERRKEHLEKCRQKYKNNIEKGQRKRIGDMTEREQRKQRKDWKKTKQQQRKRNKEYETKTEQLITPPSSPQTPVGNDHHSSKRKKRKIAKCYRDNDKLREELEEQKRLVHKYRMQLQRMTPRPKGPDTPRTKANKLLRHWCTEKGKGSRNERRRLKKDTRRTLVFHFALSEAIRSKYKELRKGKKRDVLEMMRGKILKKYKLLNKALVEFNLQGRRKYNRKGSLTMRLKKEVREFYERDDVSKMTSGVKETVTRNGVKKQKRTLTDRIDKIHERFLTENTDKKISYTSFSRLRPFWVQPPRESDRDTCACKRHENMQFMVNALNGFKLLPSRRIQDVIKLFACDVTNIDCMYGKCQKCKDTRLPKERLDVTDQSQETSWFQWHTKKEARIIKGEKRDVTVTVKETVSDSVASLVDSFDSEIERFKIHVFNISNQLNHYRYLKENLKSNEALVHIDFAENFQGKLSTEIQSLHFGASKRQVTLHTGIYYTQKGYKTFCAVSDCLDHNPCAIWAFLDPILDEMLTENKQIDVIHFFSDGPCTQYRQKGNFFLLSKGMIDRGVKATWNFHESGHGKGVPDGVGGALKRAANQLVLQGKDITDAASFISNIQEKETSVKLYEVSEKAIAEKTNVLASQDLRAVPGTFKLHQVKTSRKLGEILHREISCKCDGEHVKHQWKIACLIGSDKETSNRKRKNPSELREQEGSQSNELDSQVDAKKTMTPTQLHSSDKERLDFFSECLNSTAKCKSFKELEETCSDISERLKIKNYNKDSILYPTVKNTGSEVDEDSLKIYPIDSKELSEKYPVKVKADGNCLPTSGSVIAYGNDKQAVEMRVKIIVESTLNRDLYLNHTYLQTGDESTVSKNLAKTYAMYSDEYIAGEKLDDSKIKEVYEKEILKIVKDKTYMGIWQMFALASVLNMPLFSVYPNLGNPYVRRDLNRMIYPREKKSDNVKYIMWTTTRKDMRPRHWVPNHFVAVLPLEADTSRSDQTEKTAKAEREKSCEIEHEFEQIGTCSEGNEETIDNKNGGKDLKGNTVDKNQSNIHKNAQNDSNAPDTNKVSDDNRNTENVKDTEEIRNECHKVEGVSLMEDGIDKNEISDEFQQCGLTNENKEQTDNNECDNTKTNDENNNEIASNASDDHVTSKHVENVESYISDKKANNNENDIAQERFVTSECTVNIEKEKDDKDTYNTICENKRTCEANSKEYDSDTVTHDNTDIKENMNETDPVRMSGKCDKSLEGSANEDDAMLETNDKGEKEVEGRKRSDEKEYEQATNELRKKDTIKTGNSDVEINTVYPFFDKDITPQTLLGQFVLVQYDKLPYPGQVIDCDESEIHVRCMHRVGRRLETCKFYWPKAVRDECWYSMDDVLCVIPEPTRKGNQYYVDNSIWSDAIEMLRK